MESRNVATYRAGHEAFNRRDFGAMVKEYAESIRWTDHARSITFTTPVEFEDEFLAGWIRASSDCRVTDARYTDAGDTVVGRRVGKGTNNRPRGGVPAPRHKLGVSRSEVLDVKYHSRVVGGEIYYDQVSLLAQLELLPEPTLA